MRIRCVFPLCTNIYRQPMNIVYAFYRLPMLPYSRSLYKIFQPTNHRTRICKCFLCTSNRLYSYPWHAILHCVYRCASAGWVKVELLFVWILAKLKNTSPEWIARCWFMGWGVGGCNYTFIDCTVRSRSGRWAVARVLHAIILVNLGYLASIRSWRKTEEPVTLSK